MITQTINRTESIYFHSPQEALNYVLSGRELYNKQLGKYIFLCNNHGAIGESDITSKEAKEFRKTGKSWYEMTVGGFIYDPTDSNFENTPIGFFRNFFAQYSGDLWWEDVTPFYKKKDFTDQLVNKEAVLWIVKSRLHSAKEGSLEWQRLNSICKEIEQLEPIHCINRFMRINAMYTGDNYRTTSEDVSIALSNAGAYVQNLSLDSAKTVYRNANGKEVTEEEFFSSGTPEWFTDYDFTFSIEIQTKLSYEELSEACKETGITISLKR